uniref:Neural cell adhesion molecule L1-like protein n=1 Tax=Schistosoma haematobium TaxID=6185 RepID=A0A095BWD7_SCHHA
MKNSSIQYDNDYYKVYLNELPGKTKLKIWVRILNIQYAGPESDAIIVETEEGVPEKVSELTITFIGVNHIEVSWIKPMILNGNLISYDLEIYLNNLTDTIERISKKTSQMISSITIEDPEQCATRISGLKMNTNYSLYIWAKTAVGRELINDSTDSSVTTTTTSSSSPSSSSSLSSSSTIPFITEQDTNNNFKINNNQKIEKFNHPFMFYVQFRQLDTEIWEETQRQLHNSWIVLSNLNKDSQYEIRIVYITHNGQSIVSSSKIIHIPLINNQTSIINNQWRLLSKHNQYLITVIILCCLFLLISLISSMSLLIYWLKQKFTKKLITTTKQNYLQTFHCKQSLQYELPIEQQSPRQQQSPQQLQQQSMASYPNHIDYIIDPMTMMMMTTSTSATTMRMMNNNNNNPLDSSCICQSNEIYHDHDHYDCNSITTNNHSIPPLLHNSFITTCNSPFITFLKLPQSQTSSFTEENFYNPLINIDTATTTYTTNTNYTTTNTTDNKNNQSNQHTYISSLLSRV